MDRKTRVRKVTVSIVGDTGFGNVVEAGTERMQEERRVPSEEDLNAMVASGLDLSLSVNEVDIENVLEEVQELSPYAT